MSDATPPPDPEAPQASGESQPGGSPSDTPENPGAPQSPGSPGSPQAPAPAVPGPVPPPPAPTTPAPGAVPPGGGAYSAAPAPGVAPAPGAGPPGFDTYRPEAPGAFGRPASPGPVQRSLAPLLTSPGLTSLGITIAVVIGAAFISAVLLILAIQGVVPSRDLQVSFSLLPVLMGASLGGRLSMSVSAGLGGANVSVSMPALGTLLAAGAGVYLVARRRAGLDGSGAPLGGLCARAAVEAAATALAACVLTATSSFTSVDGGEIGDVRSSAPLTLIVVALVVFVALVAARGGETLALMMPAGLRQVLSELAALTTVAGLVMGGLVVPGTVIGALSNGDGPLILALPVYLPNLALYTLSLGCLGGLTVTGASSSGSLADAGIQSLLRNVEPVYAWDVLGGVSVLLFLALLVVVLAAAARVGVRRVRLVRPDLTRTWALGAAVLVVGVVVLNLLLPLRLSGGLLGQPVSGAAGATWSAGLTLGIVGMIVSVLAEYVPAWLYTRATGLLTLCAGRSAVSAWLAGSSGQRANRPPGPAPSTAAGAVPPPPSAPSAVSAATGAFPVVGSAPAPSAPSAVSAATGAFPVVGSAPAPSTAAGAVPPPPAPMSPKTRRRLRTGVGVLSLVLVLVVAAVVAVHVLNSRHSPDKEVATYLNLLADGHAQAANEMVDPGVSNDKRLLLTDEALGAATSRITSIRVKDADVDGDHASVDATFSLDGQKFDYTFSLTKGDSEYGLLDNWEIDDSPASPVTLTSTSFDSLIVGGQEVPLEREGGSSSSSASAPATYKTVQYAYFGVYDIAGGSSRSTYLTPDTTSLEIKPSGSTSTAKTMPSASGETVEVGGTPTQALKDLVLSSVKSRAKACVTVPTNMDPVCPSATQSSHLASLEVTTDATSVTMESGTRFTSDVISITTTPDPPKGGGSAPKPNRTQFRFSGEVTWTDGQEEPTVTVKRTEPAG